MICETEFFKALEKYDFTAFRSYGSIGFFPTESHNYFCRIGDFNYSKNWSLKIRIYDSIKFKHDRMVGCSDKSTLCENIEDLEKCLQNITAQKKKLLVDEKIKKINKLFK